MEEEYCWRVDNLDLYCSHYTSVRRYTQGMKIEFGIWQAYTLGGGEYLYVRTKQEAIQVLASQVREEIEFLQGRLSQILVGDIEE